MADESTEKQHQATSKRIETLRKQGQTMRSRDLASGLIIIISMMVLVLMSEHIKTRFLTNFTVSFNHIKLIMHDDEFPARYLSKIAYENFAMLLPFVLITFVTALLSPFIFGGWNFTLDVIQFNFAKLNPITNLKNIFSIRIFIEISRSFLKLIVIFSVFILFSIHKIHDIQALTGLTFSAELNELYDIVREYVTTLCSAVIFIVLFDVIYHYFEFQNKIKMTTQEVRDESKDTEGNADTKRRQRSMQLSLLRQRLNVTVPRSHVIVTNPTHYAVALRYEANKDKAPMVIAKGKDYIAQQIRQLAIANAIPIYEAPLLARAIYNTSNIGTNIHPGLYMSVALVLSYVHQLKNYQQGTGSLPQYIGDLKIPDELIYQE